MSVAADFESLASWEVFQRCSEAIQKDDAAFVKSALPWMDLSEVNQLASDAAACRQSLQCFGVLVEALSGSNRKTPFLTALMCQCAQHDNVEHVKAHIGSIENASVNYTKVMLAAVRFNSRNLIKEMLPTIPFPVVSALYTAALKSKNQEMMEILFPKVSPVDVPHIFGLALQDIPTSYQSDENIEQKEFLDSFAASLPSAIFLKVYRQNHRQIREMNMLQVQARHQQEQISKAIATSAPVAETEQVNTRQRRM